MTLDRDVPDADRSPEVLHRLLDGLRRLPDQRDGSDRRDLTPQPHGDDVAALPRRR